MAVPEPVTLLGVIVAVSPEDGVAVSDTGLENPLTPITVIAEVPVVCTATTRVVGLALIRKSGDPPCTLKWTKTTCV